MRSSVYPNCFVQIFDRWGQMVFQSTGYSKAKAWDGTGKSGKLAEGVYFYKFNYTELNSEVEKQAHGFLHLERK